LIGALESYFICVCYNQNLITYKDGFNKFSLFDDDKPNDHIDLLENMSRYNCLSASKEKIFKKVKLTKE